ncbi:hypothetical protein CRG98_020570 [Punica granatum]|uniref:Uncharacterized protein n=1 Tax=Punica granatum TaxID=22663 RepID=A0A2I0JRU0_PUNGR|nr:hypothetical protein CRG98_020570 [Punica granatum]
MVDPKATPAYTQSVVMSILADRFDFSSRPLSGSIFCPRAPSKVAHSLVRVAAAVLVKSQVTVLELKNPAWENSPEARVIRKALSPWRDRNTEAKRN